jgi:hypothetical protein
VAALETALTDDGGSMVATATATALVITLVAAPSAV